MRQTKKPVAAARLTAVSLFTLFAVGAAFAQPVRVEVPYEFTFASKVLPAGTYTFRLADRLVRLEPATGGELRVPIITRLSGRTDLLRDGALVFDKAGTVRTLSEVWLPETDGASAQHAEGPHPRDPVVLRRRGEPQAFGQGTL